MIASRFAAAAYAASALLLGWFAGGQAAFGRIDAALAIPFLMPGALLLARLTGDDAPGRRRWQIAAALLLLFAVQLGLHHFLAGRLGTGSAVMTLLAGILCCTAAVAIERSMRARRRWLRGTAFALAVAAWFAVGGVALAWHQGGRDPADRPEVVMLTGLPLRWSGGGDIAQMIAEGPADVPALAAIERAVDLRLVDTPGAVPPAATLFLAHPRALAPADLVAIDAHVRSGGRALILADALSHWPPPLPLGDPRNPPVTSLLTPLLDHWGIELAAPDARGAGDVDLFVGGAKLRLHSAGRFVRLPPACRAWEGGLVARCTIGRGTAWLVGDADLLHAGQWESPLASAPWLRRSDNLAWVAGLLRGEDEPAFAAPLWIRPRGQ